MKEKKKIIVKGQGYFPKGTSAPNTSHENTYNKP